MKKLRPHEVNAKRTNIHHLFPTEEDYQQLEDAMYDMLEGACETDEYGMPSYGRAMDNLIVWAQGSAQRIIGQERKGTSKNGHPIVGPVWEQWTPLEEEGVDDRLVAAESVWLDARMTAMRELKMQQEAHRLATYSDSDRMGNIKEVRSWVS